MCIFNAISHKKYLPNSFFFFDTIVENIFKNTNTVNNLQYVPRLVGSGLITVTRLSTASPEKNDHQFGIYFIGKDEVFHGLL